MIKAKQELILALLQNLDARCLLIQSMLDGNISFHIPELRNQIKECSDRIDKIRVLLKDIHIVDN